MSPASVLTEPVPRLMMTLLQLQLGSRSVAQILQGHGPEDEAVIRLCNATANITTDCVTPNHSLLTALVAFLSCVLFLMICSMAVPQAAQNRFLRALASACCGPKARHISYVGLGLYKTRSAVCRRRRLWGNGRPAAAAGGSSAAASSAAATAATSAAAAATAASTITAASFDDCAGAALQQPPSSPLQLPRPPRAQSGPSTPPPPPPQQQPPHCEVVPIRIEPVQEEGTSWTELQCQHPALVCDALFCYRSDPNIRQSSAARWLGAEETQRLLL